MSSFSDTSNWRKKDSTTLAYSYESKGQSHEGTSEMEPQSVDMQLERISLLNATSWRVKYKREPDSEAGFFTREYITALGVLDNCRLHAITLDSSPNEKASRISVTIQPAPLEKLQATSVADDWSAIGGDERPEGGWLKNEIGHISYHSAGEYHLDSEFHANVFMSEDKFEALLGAIKDGTIRSARLTLLADVFHFPYEGMGAGMRRHYYNYAILCEDEGTSGVRGTPKGIGGQTKARMQELTLEWSPKLETKMAGRRDNPDDDDDLLPPGDPTAKHDVDKLVGRLANDVQAMRGKVDLFYQAALFVVVVLVFKEVLAFFIG